MTDSDLWPSEISDTPQDGAHLLAEVLDRAARHGRSAILFAVYRAESTRALAEMLLLQALDERDLHVRRVQLPLADTRSGPHDLPLWLHAHPPAADEVLLVYDLSRAFPGILDALNYRREWFVEGGWKALFWLRDEELAQVSRAAPDFWAFRNQVVELLDMPPPERAVDLASELGLLRVDSEEYLSPEELRLRIGSRERLLAELGNAPEATAARAELLFTLGRFYQQKKDYMAAQGLFQHALSLAEQLEDRRLQSWSHQGLGLICRSLGRLEEAIFHQREAINLQPTNAYPYNNLGSVYSDMGLYEEAIAAYQQAIILSPGYARAYNNRGYVYRVLGRYAEAMADFRQAIALDTKSARPWYSLGVVYADLGRHKEAIEAYQQAIVLNPQTAYPWNGLGIAYRILGRYAEAIEAYQKAIALDAQFAYPWYGLGVVYAALGRHKEAIVAYQQAIFLDTQFASPHTMLGALYELQGQLEDALREHQRAVELRPNDGGKIVSLASVLCKLGREKEAAAHLALARRLIADDEYYGLACLEAVTGNTDAALVHLAQALVQHPGQRAWARRDPDLAALHGHPRFEELVAT